MNRCTRRSQKKKESLLPLEPFTVISIHFTDLVWFPLILHNSFMWHMAVFERVVWKWHFQTLPPLGWLTAVVFALCSSAAIWVRCSIQPSLPLVLLCRFGVSVSQKLCSTIHTAVWMRRSWANSPHPSQYESLGGSEGWNFTPGDDTPLELVSRGHYWRTELVWTDKPAVCIKGVSIRQSDNYTGHSLN